MRYDMPDDFLEFVTKKYANYKGSKYDFFAHEWSFMCGACSEKLFAPTKKTITENRLYHTRNLCLGGY